MGKRLKVLVSSYACAPDEGSEPGVGWNWVKQIARFHEVWAITRTNNRQSMAGVLAQEPLPHVHWIYFDLPRWVRFWKKGPRGVHLYYYLWQIGAYFVAKRLHKQVNFDLVHHVTFVTYWMPSFLILLPVPFIWGPVGGGDSTPRAFYKAFTLRGKMYEYCRAIACWLGEHDPFVQLTAKRARLVLATTPATAERSKRLGCQKVKVLSQVGMTREEIESLGAIPIRHTTSLRLVSVGRFLHWKGFHLGLLAFAQIQQEFPDGEYWFIGDGPERQKLERLARRCGVMSKVRFWGSLPRKQVLEKLAECDVIVHPSLHDSGGLVCLEEMAAGRPVICLDLSGPALQVTEETGIKVPATSPEHVVMDLAKAMCRLSHDPALRIRMGEAARKRVVEHFAWDKKGEWIRQVYQRISSRCS
jgi:glycosyltransferase involved in cell wall biosynthesis